MNFPPQRAGINRTGFTGYSHSAGVLPQVLARSIIAAPPGGGGGSGGGGRTCHWSLKLEPCTLCFPFTNWCWEDRCLSLTFECSGSF
jgi:hypothetical protein